jgi:hypothetical protein
MAYLLSAPVYWIVLETQPKLARHCDIQRPF